MGTYKERIMGYCKDCKYFEQGRILGYCKDCKYFEYDRVIDFNGTPFIVAHEICTRWGGGCKTREEGYCYLFEPRTEHEDKK